MKNYLTITSAPKGLLVAAASLLTVFGTTSCQRELVHGTAGVILNRCDVLEFFTDDTPETLYADKQGQATARR